MRRFLLTACFLMLAGSVCLAQQREKSGPAGPAPPNPPRVTITPQQVAAYAHQHPIAAGEFAHRHPEISGYVANHQVTTSQVGAFANQHPTASAEFVVHHPVIGGIVGSQVLQHQPVSNSGSNPAPVIYYPEPYAYPFPCPHDPGPWPSPRREPEPEKKPPKRPESSPEFIRKWLRIEILKSNDIRLTYLGDEHPVRAAQFFTEDAAGRRLHLETVDQAPFTAQVPVDNGPATIGVRVKYRDGYETTIRFPYPVPAELISKKTVAISFAEVKGESRESETDRHNEIDLGERFRIRSCY